MLATPAVAHHDHNLNNPSGCVTIKVGPFGENIGILGRGNSPVWVGGGGCS